MCECVNENTTTRISFRISVESRPVDSPKTKQTVLPRPSHLEWIYTYVIGVFCKQQVSPSLRGDLSFAWGAHYPWFQPTETSVGS